MELLSKILVVVSVFIVAAPLSIALAYIGTMAFFDLLENWKK